MELSIVIVLIAIVTAMCTTFITTYYTQTNSQVGKRDVLDDLTRVQSVTKEWIAYYDNDVNGINVDGGVLCTFSNARLWYDAENKLLIWDDTNEKAPIHKEYKLLELTAITFEAELASFTTPPQAKTIVCRTTYDELESTMLFTVFTGIQRSRYMDPERIGTGN